jgi:hypothetical protein
MLPEIVSVLGHLATVSIEKSLHVQTASIFLHNPHTPIRQAQFRIRIICDPNLLGWALVDLKSLILSKEACPTILTILLMWEA